MTASGSTQDASALDERMTLGKPVVLFFYLSDDRQDCVREIRFAMSLLLNDDYDGGMLRFPEYGPHLYRLPAGCAVVFSCSLLHEATDVTNGRRFVLLSFFYGEKEAKLREEYNRRAGGDYRAGFTSPVPPPSAAGDNRAHAAT